MTLTMRHSAAIVQALMALILTTVVYGSVARAAEVTAQVEIFTVASSDVQVAYVNEEKVGYQNINFQLYPLDGIQRIEAKLSKGLRADPEDSKRRVMERMALLDEQDRMHMRRSAIGLAKAMQYGIDRVPAIVFDGQAVVYGITDLQAALAYYQARRPEGKP